MLCVAHYEIKSEVSVFEDNRWLQIKHPKGLFRARLRNIVRKDYSAPFLLTLYLYFDAPDLKDSEEVAGERFADCLNMLALTTGCRFSLHRIRQIVDATPDIKGMRSLRFWSDSIGHDDPHPGLDERITRASERLLSYDMPPVLRRAMRWYRIGVNATIPDDQFQYFWFALELIAVAKESSQKVSDKCSTCGSPLYCETCKEHPKHWPFEKQKIRAMIQAVDKECDDNKLKMLEDARNTLMHGGTLREIQEKLPQPHEEIVDVLGKIVLLALVNQFPRELFTEKLSFLNPSTYVHRTITGIADMQTVVPVDADGEFDLSFSGTTVSLNTDGPPESARPALVVMQKAQYERLKKLAYKPGDQQDMCARIARRVHDQNESHIALVAPAADMLRILDAVKRGETGEWQDLFREIVGQPKSPPAQ